MQRYLHRVNIRIILIFFIRNITKPASAVTLLRTMATRHKNATVTFHLITPGYVTQSIQAVCIIGKDFKIIFLCEENGESHN